MTYVYITAGLALVIGLVLFTSSLGHFGTSALHLGTSIHLGTSSLLLIGTSALHLGVVTLSAGVTLTSVNRYCSRGTAVVFALLGIARGAAGANATLAWSKAPLSPAPWSSTHSHAAVILEDATAVSLQGFRKSVFAIAPGSTTLVEVTADAGVGTGYPSGHCAVRLPATDVIVIINQPDATHIFNAAWRSTDKGATFTEISSAVFPQARHGFGCIAISATEIYAFGGLSYSPDTFHNDIRVSVDAGATFTSVVHNTCGASPPMWVGRNKLSFTYMPLRQRAVISGGQSTSTYTLHNDVWYSDDHCKCWTQAKADTNIAADGFSGAVLVTVPFVSIEALLLLGGWFADETNRYRNTVRLSVDGGLTWSLVASATGTSTWKGRTDHTVVVDTRFSRLLLWGGTTDGPDSAELWTTPLDSIFAALVASHHQHFATFAVFATYCNDNTFCRVEGNETLTIVGTNFTNAAALTITIDGAPCTDVQLKSPLAATCTTPCFPAEWGKRPIVITSSAVVPPQIYNTSVSSSGSGAVVVETASDYADMNTNFLCYMPPVITSIECSKPNVCFSEGAQLKVPLSEEIIIRGMNFGKDEPNVAGIEDVDAVKIDIGNSSCLSTVTSWSATKITLKMCATSGTNLPVSITLGMKQSPPLATTIKVKVAVECDQGRFEVCLFLSL